MEETERIHKAIQDFYRPLAQNPHHRDRSWEYCFRCFQRSTQREVATDRDHAALQLGFYLAIWGMCRPTSFLPGYAYTIHLGVIDKLVAPQFSLLWEKELGAGDGDSEIVPIIGETIAGIRKAYSHVGNASDLLVTKILLGTVGCLPACDEYFKKGFRSCHGKVPSIQDGFIPIMLQFCKNHLDTLREEQQAIAKTSEVCYPLMKLIDMYFWQIGKDKAK
jgi:hypothetical protein